MRKRWLLMMATLSGGLHAAVNVELYHPHDFVLRAKVAGNPFDVVISAELNGPNAMRMRAPGFYDGDGVWKVRFSPPVIGNWTLRTVSPVAGLNGQSDEIVAVPNRNPNVHGALEIDPAHPFHFRFQDGTRFFLMGYGAPTCSTRRESSCGGLSTRSLRAASTTCSSTSTRTTPAGAPET